jgi:hypothetical protein
MNFHFQGLRACIFLFAHVAALVLAPSAFAQSAAGPGAATAQRVRSVEGIT